MIPPPIHLFNPSGGAIRRGPWGWGHFGAPRGNRDHGGIDPLAMAGQPLVTPLEAKILRRSRPYSRTRLGKHYDHPANDGLLLEAYVEEIGDRVRIFLWYFTPVRTSGHVDVGEVIGIASSIGDLYALRQPAKTRKKGKMADHIHLEIRRGDIRVEPILRPLTGMEF